MDSLVVRSSRWDQFVALALCLAGVAASVRFILAQESLFLAPALMVAFGGGAMHFAGALWKDSKRLVIDDYGIWCEEWMTGTVQWKDLCEVAVRSNGRTDYVCFTLRDPQRLRRPSHEVERLVSDSIQALLGSELLLQANRFGLSTSEIYEFARRRVSNKKAAQPGATDNPDDAQRLREDH